MNQNLLLLILSTAIWGFGFVAARWTFEAVDPYWSTSIRYLVAGALSLPFLFYRKTFFNNPKLIWDSMVCSLFLLGLILFQNIGLSLTSVAKSGFITTLYAFFVPLFVMIITRRKYQFSFWILLFVALLGIAFLCNLKLEGMNLGDFFTLLCSISAALHIIYVGRIANSIESVIEFNFLQNIFVGLFSTILALVVKGKTDLSPLVDPFTLAFWGMIFLSIISSMIAYTVQIHAQKKIPPHIAGLVFLLESPFAAYFGYLIFDEKLSSINLAGALMIVLSVSLIPVLGREVSATTKI